MGLTSEVDVNITDAVDKNSEMVAPIGDRVDEYSGAIGTITDSLKTTHYLDNKVPVYRWNFWHTYNYCCLGWYDGDDNANADWIHPEMKYMKRLFSRQGY